MVLEDHKQQGKILFPPLSGMPLHETLWHAERLPELFWLAFLCNRLGDRQALDMAIQMAVDIENTIKHLRGNEKAFRAYLPSEHMSCSNYEREQILANHGNTTWLSNLQPHLKDISIVWPDFPFSYLGIPLDSEPDAILISEVKQVLLECYHRHDKKSLIIQSIFVAIECHTEKLFFAKELDIPDLNAIFDYPDTEESQFAAGLVVSMCSQIVLQRNGPDEQTNFTWQRSFWNRCYRLEPCQYE